MSSNLVWCFSPVWQQLEPSPQSRVWISPNSWKTWSYLTCLKLSKTSSSDARHQRTGGCCVRAPSGQDILDKGILCLPYVHQCTYRPLPFASPIQRDVTLIFIYNITFEAIINSISIVLLIPFGRRKLHLKIFVVIYLTIVNKHIMWKVVILSIYIVIYKFALSSFQIKVSVWLIFTVVISNVDIAW